MASAAMAITAAHRCDSFRHAGAHMGAHLGAHVGGIGRRCHRSSRGAPAAAPSAVASSAGSPRPLQPFGLERFFAKYEFCTKHLLCCSDCEPLQMAELLGVADEESLALWGSLSLGYTETQGLPQLRQEVAKMYETVSPEELICAAPEELIYLTMRAILKPGDTVITTFPGYQSLYEVAQSIGCSVLFWEPESNAAGELEFSVTGGAVGSLESLLQQAGGSCKMVVVNFPHNPTGKTLTKRQWGQLVGLVEEAGCTLFSDEMYRLLEHDPSLRLPSAVDSYPAGAISLSGVSKTISLPGLRMGWLAMHNPELLERIAELKDYTTICASAPSEVLALMGVRARDQLLAKNISLIQETVALLRPVFDKHQDLLLWDPPVAGSIAFPRFLDTPPVDQMAEMLVQDLGVLILPGSVYGSERCTAENRFRLGLGRANQQEGVALLAEFLDNRPWVGRQ